MYSDGRRDLFLIFGAIHLLVIFVFVVFDSGLLRYTKVVLPSHSGLKTLLKYLTPWSHKRVTITAGVSIVFASSSAAWTFKPALPPTESPSSLASLWHV